MSDNTAQHRLPAGSAQPSDFKVTLPFSKTINRLLRSSALAPVASLIYSSYERQLIAEVLSRPRPNHIALILDGNRRFAAESGLPDVTEGHRYGAGKVSEVVRWCDQFSIPVVTLWALSTDNLSRDPEEVRKPLEIVKDRLAVLARDLSTGPSARQVRAVGRVDLLPDDVRRQIEAAKEKTRGSGPNILNVAVAYGGRDEIMDAVRRMVRAWAEAGVSAREMADALSKEDLESFLYSPDEPEPDLIIRTSGEVRLSGFLLW